MLQRRLVDGALAAPFGLERLHRDAVRLHAAVAAAFADELVDDDALVGIGELAALAAAPLLGRAGLVVDQHREARHIGEPGLHRHQFVAMMDRDAGRPIRTRRILFRLVGDDDDLLRALGRDLPRDDRHGQAAVVALAAGHRDRIVEQDLVGDVDAGRGRRADRQIAGVIVGAVAEVLEHVVALGERRLADPVRALAAHVGPAERVAVHPLRHEMAADARIGAHALRHHGRRVVRAAGAEIGRARRHVGHGVDRALRLLQPRHLVGDLLDVAAPQHALADRDRDVVRVERALHRKQPLFLFVALADHHRRVRNAVKLLAHLHFDQRALLLDHDDELEPLGEVAQLRTRDRPRAADLEQPDAEVVALHLVDAELIERLAHVEVALADRDDADPGVRPARRDDRLSLFACTKASMASRL